MERITSRQQQILDLFLLNRGGLSIDELAEQLAISRTAVQQHFTVLERDGYIRKGDLCKTGGRPVRTYRLTDAGINLFPKQYSWFSDFVLSEMRTELGAVAFAKYMEKLGRRLAENLRHRFEGKSQNEKIDELIDIMQELGYVASAAHDDPAGGQSIQARNCIYHDLAMKHNEVCELDTALISTLLGQSISVVECMAKGGNVCRFCVPGDNGDKKTQ